MGEYNKVSLKGRESISLALSNKKYSITTEQALRRLKILGFSAEDKPI